MLQKWFVDRKIILFLHFFYFGLTAEINNSAWATKNVPMPVQHSGVVMVTKNLGLTLTGLATADNACLLISVVV